MKYGGMSKDGEFETCDSVTEITVKPSAKHSVEYPVAQVPIFSLSLSLLFEKQIPILTFNLCLYQFGSEQFQSHNLNPKTTQVFAF